jgi:Sec-independent protein translocase protein TatA
MDSFFGIGAPELILILVIAGMVMGPERIGRTARWLGRTSSQLQNISRSFIRQLNAELDLDGDSSEIKGAWNDMQDMRRQIEELKGELMSVSKSAVNEGTGALKETRREIERTIAPPSLLPKVPETSETGSDFEPKETPNGEVPSPETVKLPNRIDVPDDPEQ